MKVSLSGLKEFIPFNISTQELSHILTMKGIEVEDIAEIENEFILTVNKEPEKDYIFELSITPNRMDCLSFVGVARELAAIFDISLNNEILHIDYKEPLKLHKNIPVSIKSPDLCGVYIGVVIDNVKISSSPEWLVKFLENVGVRSINNVVDITNYIMLKWGQPLHAFDFNRLEGPEIIVRCAKDGEKIKTLDGRERILDNSMLVIADRNNPVAIAGVMGGESSEVTSETTSIILESAWFLPQSVRKTAKKLKLPSEASHRFERGVDPDGVLDSCKKAVKRICELCGGIQASEFIIARGNLPKRKRIIFRPEKARKIIGANIKDTEMINILNRLDIEIISKDPDNFILSPPLRRFDINEEIDFIEEIARINGFENIPSEAPKTSIFIQPRESIHKIEMTAKDTLKSLGLFQVINYSFTHPKNIEYFEIDKSDKRRMTVSLQNPISYEQGVMRTFLLPQLIENIKHNISFNRRDLRLFEVGKVFYEEKEKTSNKLPEEALHAAAVLCGRKNPLSWAYSSENCDFYDIKGIAEYFMNIFSQSCIEFREPVENKDPFMESESYLDIFFNNEKIGYLGEISSKILKNFDILIKVFAFEINLYSFLNIKNDIKKFQLLPRFPFISRDSAFIFDINLLSRDVLAYINENNVNFLKNFDIFDVYTGKNIEKDKKSLAIRFNYMSPERTLTDAEVDEIHNTLIDNILKNFNGKLRD